MYIYIYIYMCRILITSTHIRKNTNITNLVLAPSHKPSPGEKAGGGRGRRATAWSAREAL